MGKMLHSTINKSSFQLKSGCLFAWSGFVCLFVCLYICFRAKEGLVGLKPNIAGFQEWAYSERAQWNMKHICLLPARLSNTDLILYSAHNSWRVCIFAIFENVLSMSCFLSVTFTKLTFKTNYSPPWNDQWPICDVVDWHYTIFSLPRSCLDQVSTCW